MRFRPCIDLHGGVVKQIVGSTLTYDATEAVSNFVSCEPAAYYAQLFQKDQLPGGHICMLGPGNQAAAKTALAAYPGGMQIGGGINDQNAAEYLNAGASHVIVTSFLFSGGKVNFDQIKKLVAAVGKCKIVFDLSCCEKQSGSGEYFVATDHWTRITDFRITPLSLQQLSGYCDEFLIHSTAVEGKKSGPDLRLLELLGQYQGENAITYAGGVSSEEDIRNIARAGGGRLDFTVGSSLDLFGGFLPYRDILSYVSKTNGVRRSDI